ncbi:HU family DNA-binding protein [Spirulina sp. 06S082]|uniref:HU family DNA-binding protein n=1 Tax=Spirulina sp. 06S082 TaxID=3110248 RepID=UPI002B206495|nr:HU family DNA-binding protein [Spirulina sp. 06S082]MEA5469671.1 HU family DNA-binding protein [Spirulina sp. 06S082]
MNKEQLVNKISEKTTHTKKETDKILTATVQTIMETVAEGEKVTLVGFGTFEGRDRKERTGRNPQTGAEILIPATTVPAFSPGKLFKEKVAGKTPEA